MNFRENSPGNGAAGIPAPSPSDCLVEIGAKSLKIHRQEFGFLQTEKHPYELGHEVYQTGKISQETVRGIVDRIRAWGRPPALAIATSAVRDAENPEVLIHPLREDLGIEVTVLTCFEEATLLARGYLARRKELPVLILDIGGGSIETAFLTRSRRLIWDCLPLGVIRLYHLWKTGGSLAMALWIDAHLKRAAIVHAEAIVATGGTVKALAKSLGKTTFGRKDLAGLEARIRREGPPPGLKPDRAELFLPGVVLVRSLFELVRAECINYLDISVGQQALEERLGAINQLARCVQPRLAKEMEPVHISDGKFVNGRQALDRHPNPIGIAGMMTPQTSNECDLRRN